MEIDNECKKAFIRRGLSYYDQSEYDLAKKDLIMFQKLAQKDDNDKEKNLAKRWMNKIQIAKQKELDKEKQIYGGFLDKKSKNNVSLYDDKKNDSDMNDDDNGICWKIVMFIPNLFVSCFDECTKYCRKKTKND